MTTNSGGCGCGDGKHRSSPTGTAMQEAGQVENPGIRPGLINRKTTLLISLGAAMAGNCEPCLRKLVPNLREIGASDDEIRGAVMTGQMVKERPIAIMKGVADELTGTSLSQMQDVESCPGDMMVRDDRFKTMMLIAAGAAMAANCEFCLNKVVPDLIDAGVSETDIRRAVEIGQFVKDKPAAIMKEAADILTGSRLSEKPAQEDCGLEASRQGASCCG